MKHKSSVSTSLPKSVSHTLHVGRDLKWTFDPNVDPKTIFTTIKVIGKGGFGTVSQIIHRPSFKVLAAKQINEALLNDSTKQAVEDEINLMRQVETPYTVQYYGSVTIDNTVNILMEFCDRGSLRDILNTRQIVFSEDQIAVIMHDLLSGLKMIHNNYRIIHRDIKAANILINSKSQLKIVDFGVSCQFDPGSSVSTTIVGTPYWMAPEVIEGTEYSFPADIWAVGITAVELAEGAPPYIELTPTKAMIEITLHGFPGYRFPAMHSPEFRDFVSKCVAFEPEKRASIDELLEHPFLKACEFLNKVAILQDVVDLSPVNKDYINKLAESSDTFTPKPRQVSNDGKHKHKHRHRAESIGPASKNNNSSLKDPLLSGSKEFLINSRMNSLKIPFAKLEIATMPKIDVKTIYRTTDLPIQREVPLIDEDGVLDIKRALKDKRAVPITAFALIIISLFFLGGDGLMFLLVIAFITDMFVVHFQNKTT